MPPIFSLFLFLWSLSPSGVNGQGTARDLPIGLFPLSALGLPCLRSGGGGTGGSVLRAHPFFTMVAWCLFQTALPLFCYPVSLRRSSMLAWGSGFAASTCSGACRRCLRIALGPGADFPLVSLPCGRVVLMGQRLVIVSSPLGGCVSFTPFWLGSVASARSLSESWLFFLLWICQCYCRIQWRRPSRKLLRFP